MATSFLLFSGVYAATCRERSKRLAMLARNARAVAEYPFALRDFASQVEACTQWKLSSGEAVESETRNFWETAVVYAWLLWRWELARLTGADPRLGEFRLLSRWFRLQPLGERWREWALEEQESRPFIQRALELGINFFDTADMYSGGASEEILGRALRDLGPSRDKVVIATNDRCQLGQSARMASLQSKRRRR